MVRDGNHTQSLTVRLIKEIILNYQAMRTTIADLLIKRQRDIFLLITLVLLLCSLFFYLSISSSIPQIDTSIPYRYLGALLAGISVFALIQRYDAGQLRRLSWTYLVAATVVCWLTLVPFFSVVHSSGKWRWIRIWNSPLLPTFNLHSGMVALVLFLVFLSALYADKNRLLSLKEHFALIMLYLLMVLGLLIQPDVPIVISLIVMTCIAFILFERGKMAVLFLGAGTAFIVFSYINKPYRLKRILGFLDPWADPQGTGFNLIQALRAIHQGKLTGSNLPDLPSKLYELPGADQDFAYAMLTKAFGFIGAMLLIIAFVLFAYYGLKAAQMASNRFVSLLTALFTMLIVVSALSHMLVVTSLMPTMGISLPFVSRSGLMLVLSLATAGLIYRQLGNKVPAEIVPVIKVKGIMMTLVILYGVVLAITASIAFVH